MEYEKAKALLTAPVIAADDFFESLKRSSFFAPADQISVPKVNTLTSNLTEDNVKHQTTIAVVEKKYCRISGLVIEFIATL